MEKPRTSTHVTTVKGRLAGWVTFVILALYSSPLLAVNCTPDSITLSSQAEVDSFQVDHGPGCDTIVSALTVDGLSITDLTPLSGLTTIAWASTIKIQNTSLISFTGLSGLTSVFTFEIHNNTALTSIAALSALTTIDGALLINGNTALTNLDGLDNVISLTHGGLFLENNTSLSDLSGLSGLTNIGGGSQKAVALPWVSFNSDEASMAPEGVFLKSSPHPRAYGSFARVLAKYVRDEKVITLQEAIRKLAALPSQTLKVDRRGELKTGFYADVVVFDPDKIQDHATFIKPHQYATGMLHVFVNGTQVLKDGEHTGAKPGRVVRGPGWKPQT